MLLVYPERKQRSSSDEHANRHQALDQGHPDPDQAQRAAAEEPGGPPVLGGDQVHQGRPRLRDRDRPQQDDELQQHGRRLPRPRGRDHRLAHGRIGRHGTDATTILFRPSVGPLPFYLVDQVARIPFCN